MRNILKISLITVPTLAFSSWIEVKEDVNVRQAPSFDSKIIKTYTNGDKIKFSKKLGSWYRVEEGFLFVENKKEEEQKDIPSEQKIENKDMVYIKYFEDLAIYEKDTFNSKQVGNLQSENALEVECEANNSNDIYPWYKTSLGYLNSPYLYNPKMLKNCEEDKKEIIPVVVAKSVEKPKKIEKPRVVQKPKKQIKEVLVKEEKIPQKEEKNDIFVGVLFGVNALNVNSENKSGSVTINSPLDESGYSFNAHIGTNFDENYRVILNYDYLGVDDVTLQNYYLSINYQWNRYLNPYVGISSGVSLLTWETDPLTNSSTKDADSEASGFFGLQGGVEYKYNRYYSVISQLLYQEFFHKTKLTSGTNEAEITHDRVFQIGIGLRYFFID